MAACLSLPWQPAKRDAQQSSRKFLAISNLLLSGNVKSSIGIIRIRAEFQKLRNPVDNNIHANDNIHNRKYWTRISLFLKVREYFLGHVLL